MLRVGCWVWRSPYVPPSNTLGYCENFLYMLDKLSHKEYVPHPKLARALDVLFILHADHEQNCSTAAMRHLTSGGVDVYTAIGGAAGALYGPRHGGANEVWPRAVASRLPLAAWRVLSLVSCVACVACVVRCVGRSVCGVHRRCCVCCRRSVAWRTSPSSLRE